MRIEDPLPQQFLTREPGVGGRIKVRPEDFLVDEIPLYEPEGTGEHLYLGIQKSNVAHGELMSTLRRHFKVTDGQIGFAGMKDKVGITRQTVSIHLLRDVEDFDLKHSRISVLWSKRHRNKLRLGHLAGNRFSIRIRGVDPMSVPLALRTLRLLEEQGIPNYFGLQRFGYRRNNHLIGAAVMRSDWAAVISEVLGASGTGFPEYQRQRRELFEAGKVAEAAAMWTPADRSERIMCGALARGKRPKDAVLAIGSTALKFWVSALQSAMFNRVLDRRLSKGLLAELINGDLACRHDSRGVFRVTPEHVASGELRTRVQNLEISPSGPLWGVGMMRPDACVLEAELEALSATGLEEELFTSGKHAPEGGRRALRCTLQHASVEGGADEHGPFIRVAFDLPRGAYATIVLREIMKSELEPLEQRDPPAEPHHE